MDNLKGQWDNILEILKTDISAIIYDTWVKTSVPYALEDNVLYLQVENEVAKTTMERKYLDTLQSAIHEVTGKKYTVALIVGNELPIKKVKKSSAVDDAVLVNSNLNSKYIFDTFVVGNSNRMAHAASLAVAESPADNYNPLFLYGNSGLGKTHLMHSIAHFILENNANAKVLYVTSETFTNELIQSIQTNKNEAFRNKYRNIDVLLIDDIQFISKKEGTQEEFFHTFNALHGSSKQIIISSDRPPKEIETLEERLRTRFGMGLIADIQSPDYETRIAILQKKAETDSINVPNDVIEYIANNIASNIRELEGALTRIIAFATLTKEEISISLAEGLLKNIFSENSVAPLTVALIQEVVADYFNISVAEIQGSKKPKHIAFPRQVAMYLCRKLMDISLPKIGYNFGGRDHTTAIHAISKIEKQLESDPELQSTIMKIEESIKGIK